MFTSNSSDPSNRALLRLKHNHLRGDLILSTVSGVLTTETGMIRYFEENVPACDIITSKSYQVIQTFGHREPVICSPEEGNFGNFVGLRNPGMNAVYPELAEMRRKPMRALLNISLSAGHPEDFIKLINTFDPIADIIELNFSCPHAMAGFGASIGSKPEIASAFISAIVHAIPYRRALLITKLTPNVHNIAEIAKAVIHAGADGIAAINTVGPFEYTDPVSGQVIFSKAEGGKGGASGIWVRERALQCVREIRQAIGDDPIILGMGGVTTASDAQMLMEAGADSVGIGSALSRIEMKDYNHYFNAIKAGEDVTPYIVHGNKLTYKEHTILSVRTVGGDMQELILTGELNCKPGQFAFLWIPQVGEKPFSVAGNHPLKFLIKRRGPFTEACFSLKPGDKIFTRGLYGKPLNIQPSAHALLLAGGSGVAVLPLIADELKKLGVTMDIRVGVLQNSPVEALSDVLPRYGATIYIADNGKPGRVLDSLRPQDVAGDTRVYIVGPGPMMDAAAKKLILLGIPPEKIALSMEKLTLCGIGMCGECFHAGRLICKEGTFYSYDELQ